MPSPEPSPEITIASWYLQESLLGSGEYRGTEFHSLAYFCPECGQIWARIIRDPSDHHPRRRNCPNHGPGFLLTYSDVDLNDSAPLLVLEREFLKAMSYNESGRTYDTALIADGGCPGVY